MGQPRGVIRRLADETGLDHKTVRRAMAETGWAEADCEADFDGAAEMIRSVSDTDRVIGHAAGGRGEGGTSGDTYAAAKAQAELHRARKLELQNAKLEGSLVDRQAVTDTGARIFADVRTALLSLGPRIAPKVLDRSDAREVARIVVAEVRDVLSTLADETRFFAALEAEALS